MSQVVNIKAGADAEEGSLADQAYARIKQRIFDFELMPGDRLSESELAEAMAVSRTPLRQALQRLQHEGFVEAIPKVGWLVPPLSFDKFDELYDFRVLIECFAVRELCADATERPGLAALAAVWHVKEAQRLTDPLEVGLLDEAFHLAIVESTGNREMLRTYREITERMRIIRRLDFTVSDRVAATCAEHGKILTAIQRRRADEAQRLLSAHIEHSKLEVRKITLDTLYQARSRNRAARGQ
ncbi:MAG: GntR family transcriptional regulator [Betaproteobacteria bacterium]|nr:GntR family transcriptional regulator [Betaproteobacteria bacterium]